MAVDEQRLRLLYVGDDRPSKIKPCAASVVTTWWRCERQSTCVRKQRRSSAAMLAMQTGGAGLIKRRWVVWRWINLDVNTYPPEEEALLLRAIGSSSCVAAEVWTSECILVWMAKIDRKEFRMRVEKRCSGAKLEWAAGKPLRALPRVLRGAWTLTAAFSAEPPGGFILPLSQFNEENE